MSTRFSCETGKQITDPKVDAFLQDIEIICYKHNMCLGHQDHQGAFEVYREILPDAIDWLMDANIADSSVRKRPALPAV